MVWRDLEAVDPPAATDKVRFQHQEVAYVVADTEYIARDALDLIYQLKNLATRQGS